jgi:competence ComEA-like helix-hairpin-helix protein
LSGAVPSPPHFVWEEAMSSFRSFLGASLPRSHQAIILVLGVCLTGMWAWQAGLILPNSAPGNVPPQQYFIEISGDIPSPGFHLFPSSPTVQQVWEKAGGRGMVPNGSQVLTSGSKVNVASDRITTVARMSGSDLLTLGLKIDLNQATAADLEAIPGVGPVLGKHIVEFREGQGPFQKVEDLMAVKGLGHRKLEKIRQYLTVTEIEIDQDNGLKE